MAISSPGIGSNLDVNGIVAKLMTVEQQPLTLLAQKEASYQAKLSGYGSLGGALSSFQTALSGLTNLSKFQNFVATPADTTIMTASAASTAVPGTYSVTVGALAQAQTLRAAGQVSTTATIGAGTATTLTFQFGTFAAGAFTQDPAQATGSVTINSTNNSLQGIRDAVNAANIGVTATIINDGSAAPNRLVLTSNKTGANSTMKITAGAGGDATVTGLLSYDPALVQSMTQTAAAQDASVTINGVAVSSASNLVTGAIQGVTLSLAKIGTTNLNVVRDTGSVQTAVQAFVKAYNDINSTLANLTAYNPTTKQAGPLLGDSAVRNIQAQIRRTLSSPLAGLSGSLTTLSQIGVAFQKDGTLGLDATKLQSAITNNFNDIASLLAAVGKPTDSLVNYVSATGNAKAGSYAVNVSTLATQSKTIGSINLNPPAVNTMIAAGTTVTVAVDGISASVALTAGSYTGTQLATLIQSAINGTAAFSSAGSSVAASVDAVTGFLSITSNRYGSASSVSMGSGTGTAVATFMGTPTTSAGLDAAGTIDGVAAGGSGQYLTGAAGSATDGLKIQITGGGTGARGVINYSQGYANNLNNLVSQFLASPGLISSQTDGLNRSLKDIAKRRDAMNLRLTAIEKNYRTQFTSLDVLIGQMSQTSSYLTQQLANLPKVTG
ncbi:flagellar hook-associated protein 2 [Sulfuricella sp. T08]|uniref:flagellar filament capping protein FliD n=1 Tax=Sulfuricella sp. T08 TaxID=1632857 RepID=UPI0006179708|nr:flagellar filament capping protein FliD [Sulfuricella sp. T08]GAO35713.1 flagellar hook-associated protein 2 [Sulfuricella sp. T08]